MSIVIEGGRVPNRLSRVDSRSLHPTHNGKTEPQRVRIALINNMPDAALEDTEVQFFGLLDSAAGTFRCRSNYTRCLNFPAAMQGSSILKTSISASTTC